MKLSALSRSVTIIALVVFHSFPVQVNAAIRIENLKVEYETTPLGIDVRNPRFSWQMKATGGERGCYQRSYRVEVTDESARIVWDSGKVDNGESLNIYYSGLPLQPATTYRWRVHVWDQEGKPHVSESWFETGLMNPEERSSAWSGAQWIGAGDPVLYAHYLPVYRISYSLQLDKASHSTKASFIYGANDPRLMDKNRNLYNLENPRDSSYIRIEIDVEGALSGNNAVLNIYRAGYHPQDKNNAPFQTFPIPDTLINGSNAYGVHTVHISSVLGYTQIYIDGADESGRIARVNLNPLGQGGDFIAFPVLGDIGYSVPAEMTATFSGVEIRNYRSPSNILFSESGPRRVTGGVKGSLATGAVDKNAMPMLRTTFDTTVRPVEKARLYVTARGIYEMYINGRRVSSDYFNPGLSQYNKTHFYQTYDVTSLIVSGKNAMGAVLGEGWWSGGATFMGDFWNFFGDRQSLLAKLVIRYADGSEDVVVTNPESWSCYNDGPVVYGSFFQGEVYDARREKDTEGWSLSDYEDKGWTRASVVSLHGTINCDSMNAAFQMPLVNDYSGMRLTGNVGSPPRKIKELTAISVSEPRPGIYVYDMGQNMVGVPKIWLSGYESGREITMRFAEVLYPDLPEYKEHTGMLMLENVRAAMAQDIYITKGGEEVVNPRFTFHGYRYIEITGITRPLPLDAVKGEVISSIHALASGYETSNAEVNKLWENIVWSTLGNFLSIPTDCPQRNERLGWGGDISVFSRTATYLADVPQFLNRHMTAMRDVQREDGRFTDVAPLGGGFGGILWGSAGITVAWESYRQYNDKQLLIDHYDAMKSYIGYILDKNIDSATNLLVQENPGAWTNLSDWLGPEDGRNDNTLLWEAYFIYDLQLMEQIASLLGKQEDQAKFKELLEARKSLFHKTYIDPVTRRTIHSGYIHPDKRGQAVDTQTSYVLPLAFGVLPENEKDKVAENLVKTITRSNVADNRVSCPPYSLMTGFIGTAWINDALSECGYNDVAYRLLQQNTYPSWLYSVEQGATTIWERLNSYTHTNGFGGNNRMNSFNHYSFGAVGAWMYAHSLGIARDERQPGFHRFILQPEYDPTGQMTYAKGFYDSMYGRIESSWEYKDGTFCYTFEVPANTVATLYLRATSPRHVTENGKPLAKAKGVRYVGQEGEKCVYELNSGKYVVKTGKHLPALLLDLADEDNEK